MDTQKKIEIIESAIKRIHDDKNTTICIAIADSIGYNDNGFSRNIGFYELMLEEILPHKPQHTFNKWLWFPENEEGKAKRLDILNQVLKQYQDEQSRDN